MKFFELYMEEAPGEVLGVLACPDGLRVFDWFPNTGLWHRDSVIERDVFHEDYRLVPLPAERVLEVRSRLPRRDERNRATRRRLAEIEAAPASWTMSDAQVGIPVQPGGRPLSGQWVRTWLGSLDVDETVPVALYEEDSEASARVLASDIRRGARRALAGASWRAQVVATGAGWLVLATRNAAAA